MESFNLLSSFVDFGKKIFRSLISDLISLGLHYKLYLFGMAVLLISVVILKQNRPVMSAFATIGSLSFAIGFFAWCWPLIRFVWSKDIGKLGLGVMNVFVLLVTTVLARYFVAESLRLPPQDFDLTVNFCVFFLYIPCLALVLAVITCIAAIGILLWCLLTWAFPRKQDGKLFMHFIGAFAFCSYCATTFDFTNEHAKSVGPAIRFIAWMADFQPASGYPGVKADERIRLLENGVVSVASMKDLDVNISLRPAQ